MKDSGHCYNIRQINGGGFWLVRKCQHLLENRGILVMIGRGEGGIKSEVQTRI